MLINKKAKKKNGWINGDYKNKSKGELKIMTQEETRKILMGISCSFPNFKPDAPTEFIIDVWADDLKDYSYEEVYKGLKAYKTTDTSGFAPSVGQIIDKIHSLKEIKSDISPEKLWAKVYKAICNSNYHAEEEFEKLPEIAQRVLGSHKELSTMASDENFNYDVEKSHFIKAFNRELKLEKELRRMPIDVRPRLNIDIVNCDFLEDNSDKEEDDNYGI